MSTTTTSKAQDQGTTSAAAKAKTAKVQAARAKAAEARLAALPDDKRQAILGHLAQLPGYRVVWPKGAWSTLTATSQAPEGSPKWMIMCNTHGTAKAIPSSKAAEAEGTKAQMVTWCKPCKAAKAKADREAAKAEAAKS